MKWELARIQNRDGTVTTNPCAITSGPYAISRAPAPGYGVDGIVRYELSKPGEPIRMIRCADTEAERARTVAVLKALAKT